MKRWKIEIEPLAKRDLEHIIGYIAYTLQEPQIAARIYHRIRDSIYTLAELPERCPLYQSEAWRSRDVRRLLVGKYCVFYRTVEESELVCVMRIAYARRNLSEILSESE